MLAVAIVKQMIKTSWSTEHLRQLKELTNHKVVFDGYEFVWMSKIDDKWRRHYIRNFDDYNTPMSWIYHNIYLWSNEYKDRNENYFKDMIKELEVDVKIKEISNEYCKKTKQKVNEIKMLKPTITNKEIADILEVSIRTVERHLK